MASGSLGVKPTLCSAVFGLSLPIAVWGHSHHLTGLLLCLSSQVEGYAVGCECSPCGDLLVTGSADGRVLMFSFRTARRACTLQGHAQACLGTTYHPVLPSVLGTCSWGGDIKIWH